MTTAATIIDRSAAAELLWKLRRKVQAKRSGKSHYYSVGSVGIAVVSNYQGIKFSPSLSVAA